MNELGFPVSVGSVIQGKYRVERVLGRGGMGCVVLATQLVLERLVALKFLLPEIQAIDEAALRFKREARALAQLKSEHAVKIFEVGEHEGAGYLAMEYLEGIDLARHLATTGPQPAAVAADYVLQACEAIAEAHALGIVHRDLKPANLFLTERDGAPMIKVLDFGIAKAPLGSIGVAQTSHFLGSPMYSAPEQLTAAGSVDARADVWALGVILFELCSGTTPHAARSVAEVMAAILSRRVPDVRSVRADIPAGMAQTIAACLEPELERRLSSVAELARRLADFAPPTARISVERVERALAATSATVPSSPPAAPAAQSARLSSFSTELASGGSTETHLPQSLSVASPPSVAAPRRGRPFLVLGALGAVGVLAALTLPRFSSQDPARATANEPVPGGSSPVRLVQSVAALEQAPLPAPSASSTAGAASASVASAAPTVSASAAPTLDAPGPPIKRQKPAAARPASSASTGAVATGAPTVPTSEPALSMPLR